MIDWDVAIADLGPAVARLRAQLSDMPAGAPDDWPADALVTMLEMIRNMRNILIELSASPEYRREVANNLARCNRAIKTFEKALRHVRS